MQGHMKDTQDIEKYMKAMEKYAEAVDEVQVTELDVGCSSEGDDKWQIQAEFYYNFFKALIEEVNKGVNLTCVTIWGLTDDTSWRTETEPLIFNADLSKKPAFDAIVKAVKGEAFTEKIEEVTEQVIEETEEETEITEAIANTSGWSIIDLFNKILLSIINIFKMS
jgi:predicted secreted protein